MNGQMSVEEAKNKAREEQEARLAARTKGLASKKKKATTSKKKV